MKRIICENSIRLLLIVLISGSSLAANAGVTYEAYKSPVYSPGSNGPIYSTALSAQAAMQRNGGTSGGGGGVIGISTGGGRGHIGVSYEGGSAVSLPTIRPLRVNAKEVYPEESVYGDINSNNTADNNDGTMSGTPKSGGIHLYQYSPIGNTLLPLLIYALCFTLLCRYKYARKTRR